MEINSKFTLSSKDVETIIVEHICSKFSLMPHHVTDIDYVISCANSVTEIDSIVVSASYFRSVIIGG